MLTFTHVLETSASPAAVWALVADPVHWSHWQSGLKGVHLGRLEAGAQGEFQIHGHGRRRFRVQKVAPPQELVWVLLGLARTARVSLRLEPCELGTRITQRVDVSGAGSWMDPLFRTKHLARALPDCTRALARLAARG